jgi:mRNA-degrading endonuclease RelE of RelBE toxin-antitoxin system
VKILLTERFQKSVTKLDPTERARVFETLLEIPKAMKSVHRHAGIGLRKLHRSGIYEARIGLGLRLVFALRAGDLILAAVGTHDQVRKYLSEL